MMGGINGNHLILRTFELAFYMILSPNSMSVLNQLNLRENRKRFIFRLKCQPPLFRLKKNMKKERLIMVG